MLDWEEPWVEIPCMWSLLSEKKKQFFRWYNDEVLQRHKKIIRALSKKNDALKNMERNFVIFIVMVEFMLL